MPLTQEQIEQFKRDGYTTAPDFFDRREVQAMQAEVARWFAEDMLHNVATDGDGKTQSTKAANLQMIPLYPKSPLFKALPFQPKVIDAVSSLIGDPMILHLDQSFYKPAHKGAGTNWHQDNGYFKISDPQRGTALWIAVHDATEINGTIRVIPGVFNEAYEHTRDPQSNHHVRCYPPEEREVSCVLPAGGVVFFCYGVPHATGPNHTDKDRAGVAFHFLHASNAKDDLIAEGRDCRPYLTGPKATQGEKEYGQRVEPTAWDAEVDKLVGATA